MGIQKMKYAWQQLYTKLFPNKEERKMAKRKTKEIDIEVTPSEMLDNILDKQEAAGTNEGISSRKGYVYVAKAYIKKDIREVYDRMERDLYKGMTLRYNGFMYVIQLGEPLEYFTAAAYVCKLQSKGFDAWVEEKPIGVEIPY